MLGTSIGVSAGNVETRLFACKQAFGFDAHLGVPVLAALGMYGLGDDAMDLALKEKIISFLELSCFLSGYTHVDSS